MAEGNRLQQLLRRWQQAQAENTPVTVEELCQDCPELKTELDRCISALQALSPIPQSATGSLQRPSPSPSLTELGSAAGKGQSNLHMLKQGGEPLPGYFLVEFLGRGSYGEVWKATGPGGFPLALKFITLDHPALATEVRALDLMKNLRHANLLSYFGAWQTGGLLIIALELADGTLMDRLVECQGRGLAGIPFPELIDYMRDIAKGIDFLNDYSLDGEKRSGIGIQHRDIKPQNLMLVGGSGRVGDFGLAKLMEHSVTSNTGAMTLAYAAPEFFSGETAKTSDQYSLAVTYCQLRTGQLPFRGQQAEIVSGHISRPPDLSGLPKIERPVVSRALSKMPDSRWPSCREFVEALARQGMSKTPPAPITPQPNNSSPPVMPQTLAQSQIQRTLPENIESSPSENIERPTSQVSWKRDRKGWQGTARKPRQKPIQQVRSVGAVVVAGLAILVTVTLLVILLNTDFGIRPDSASENKGTDSSEIQPNPPNGTGNKGGSEKENQGSGVQKDLDLLMATLLAQAREAQNQKEWDLALECVEYVLEFDEENAEALRLKSEVQKSRLDETQPLRD